MAPGPAGGLPHSAYMLHWYLHGSQQAGTHWLQLSLTGTSERRELLACRVVLPAYGAGPYLPAIVMERPVYVREMSDGLYSPLTYLLYKVGAHSAAQALSQAPHVQRCLQCICQDGCQHQWQTVAA